MSHRSRIAHFKTPFIVSIAVPAALGLACGGRTDVADAIGGAGSSSVSDGGSSAGGSGGSASCSGPAPDATSSPCGSGGKATCIGGKWVVPYISCNPPPPPRIQACPDLEPQVATSCADYASDLRCSYDYCYGARVPTRRCNGSTSLWEELPLLSCNPPQLDPCPAEMPIAGSDCTFEAQECRYDGCQGPQSSVAICSFGQWTTAYSSSAGCNPPAIAPVCPTRELSAGEGCAFEGQACSQEPCASASRSGFVCSAGAWQATVLSCSADAGAYPGF
jgi:hypothetical protein